MNQKIEQLKKIKNQIGGKGTMRRVKKKRTIKKKTQVTFEEKQYLTIHKQFNNYYTKIEKNEKILLKTFLKKQLIQLFNEFKRKDYYKKKVMEENKKHSFIEEYILNDNDNDNETNVTFVPIKNNYKMMCTVFSKQGINHYNDFMFNVWDLINQKKYLI